MIPKTESIWHNGAFEPWDEVKVHVLTHALHYGSGVFEGIRAYKTESGTAIFRLQEHIERFFYSAQCIGMTLPYTVDQLVDACRALVHRSKVEECYIRPLAFYGYKKLGVNPIGNPIEIIIACWPWGKYLDHDACDIKISKYIRLHPRSVIADAKVSGHYVNSILAILEIQGTHYHEALFLDLDGNICEGPGENFFMVKDGSIITPPLGGILAGITRKTVFEMAASLGIPVIEKLFPAEEAFSCDEAFFSGTAVEIMPIRSIDDHIIGSGKEGIITNKIRELFGNVTHGRSENFRESLTLVA